MALADERDQPPLHQLLHILAPGDEVLLTCLDHDANFTPWVMMARDRGVTFLNELGLDPGIDHMSAMRVIHGVRQAGGRVVSFRSYCGGLPAPELLATVPGLLDFDFEGGRLDAGGVDYVTKPVVPVLASARISPGAISRLASSTAVVEIVATALRVIGINGYREDHPDSVGRLLRDSYAPQLMVSNDRIRTGNAQLILGHRGLT